MGPPPPSPRIEGQQHNQHPPNQYRKPRPSVASAPPLSSYASLASAPPPSFARKTTTTTTANASSGSTAGPSNDYRSSPRSSTAPSSSSTFVPRGGGGRGSLGGRGGSRYDGGGRSSSTARGRGPPYRGGGPSSSGGRGRYDDRFGSRTGSSSSLDGRGRGGRIDDGGRFYNNRRGGRDPAPAGRFDSASRGGRGRGRDYMYAGRGGGGRGGRSYHSRGGGRGGYSREEGGRGRYNDGYGGDNSYSSFGDNNSVGEPYPRSNSFSDELPMDGPPPEIASRGGYHRSSTASSDGGRSVSPYPGPGGYGGRRPYGSFSNNSTSNMSDSGADFRRSASQEGEPGEEDPRAPFPPINAKRRREDSYAAAATEEPEPVKRIARDPIDTPPEPGPSSYPLGTSSDGGDGPPSAEISSRGNVNETGEEPYRGVDTRLTEEGRWTSPAGISRDSPHSTRRMYSGGGQFEDAPDYRDSFGGRGRGVRGRGRGSYRGRGGRGDYNRSSSADYGGQRDYGSRFPPSNISDRRPSVTIPPEGGRPPENSPRQFPQYSELASSSAPSWRRLDSDDGPPNSPRTSSDWRKPTPAPRLISSYATLATAPPPPRPSPSTPAKPLTPAARLPTPEPEKPKTPPPSPGPPSGYTVALTRLADLEAQMEFAYAKHNLLVKRHKALMTQYDHLEGLPVGVEAFQAELEAMVGLEKAHKAEDAALYG